MKYLALQARMAVLWSRESVPCNSVLSMYYLLLLGFGAPSKFSLLGATCCIPAHERFCTRPELYQANLDSGSQVLADG